VHITFNASLFFFIQNCLSQVLVLESLLFLSWNIQEKRYFFVNSLCKEEVRPDCMSGHRVFFLFPQNYFFKLFVFLCYKNNRMSWTARLAFGLELVIELDF